MPRDPRRIDNFLDELKKYWHTVPDWRFAQLIENVFNTRENPFFFYVEDDQAMKRLREFFNDDAYRTESEQSSDN